MSKYQSPAATAGAEESYRSAVPSIADDILAEAASPADCTPTGVAFAQVLAEGANENDSVRNGDKTCYLHGTHILTPTGEVPIETLHVGDRVVTRFGGIRAIRWIGHQALSHRVVHTKRDELPVCLRAGSLGDQIPARDLYVSPGHAMLLGDHLILAKSLVNGITITQDHCPDEIFAYQLDLGTHDCIIAEGAWSETFADGPGLRERFHNHAEFAGLFPEHPSPGEPTLCATRPETGPDLEAALRPILARATAKVIPGPLHGWIDRIPGRWKIEGWAVDTSHPEIPVLLDIFAGETQLGSILACDYRADLKEAGFGEGRCSFTFMSPVKLHPDMLATLHIRRASDGADLGMSDTCRTSLQLAGLARLVA